MTRYWQSVQPNQGIINEFIEMKGGQYNCSNYKPLNFDDCERLMTSQFTINKCFFHVLENF